MMYLSRLNIDVNMRIQHPSVNLILKRFAKL